MSDRSRLLKLAGHLRAEIQAARAGDTQGQFPILDLIGNLRDEAGANAELSALATLCTEAWERTVRIVESGQPFSPDDIIWLNDLLARVQTLAELGQRRTRRDLSEFSQQVIGKRHAHGRCPDLKTAVKNVRNISNLNHACHAMSIAACDAHFKA